MKCQFCNEPTTKTYTQSMPEGTEYKICSSCYCEAQENIAMNDEGLLYDL